MTTFRINISEFNEHTLAILQLLKTDKSIEVIEEVTETDWYDELTKEQKASIERGLEDVKAGRVTPHETVMSDIRQKIESKKTA
jgi:predicted transcriptional regulator